MYGPPPDPREIVFPASPADQPLAWGACILIGLALAGFAGTRRPFLLIVGVVVAATAPAAALCTRAVWGAFPTIDKAGSLLFYLDGVHRRVLDAADPAVRLIGVHMGHLWITAGLDLLVEPFAAFNLQALLNLVLGWYCAFLLLEELSAHRPASLLMAFPFGMGLHLFRDVNWYTIEKSGVYWVPLYAWALVRAGRRGGAWIPLAAAIYAGAFFYNIYFGVLCAGLGALALLARDRRVALAVALSALAAAPLAWQQARLLAGLGTLGDPQTFLEQRAALDVVSLWPPRWNRLEAWRAVDLVAVAAAVAGAARPRNRWLVGVGAVYFVLALGPSGNPVYAALAAVPGLWRLAKPETFFHVTYLALLAVACRSIADARPGRRALFGLAALLSVGWIAAVRLHPVYPHFTQPMKIDLATDWKTRLPGAKASPDRSPASRAPGPGR